MRALIVHNSRRQDAVEAVNLITSWMDEKGIEYVIAPDKDDAVVPGTAAQDGSGQVDFDIAVVAGGDGTILRCARLMGNSETPILGFDYGTLGFLAGASSNDIVGALEKAFARELSVQHRATIQADIEFNDHTFTRRFCLNEIAINSGVTGSIVDFDLVIDGARVAHIRGDGMVVATATGSTAYCLSSGGPFVAPGHMGTIVVPVAPHTLTARAIVTGPEDVVELYPTMVHDGAPVVVADGRPIPNSSGIKKVTVKRGKGDVILLGKDGERFFKDIAKIFYGDASYPVEAASNARTRG